MSIVVKRPPPRRAALRGLVGGGAVTVALPFLDCFLDDNGGALASGAPLPVRFGTWYWGMGHTPGHAIVDRTETGTIEFLEECKALVPHLDQINYFGGFNTPLDGNSNYPHHSGWVGSRTGTSPVKGSDIPAPTFDVLVSDAIGSSTRFRNLDITSMGNAKESYTARNTFSRPAAETSPLAFYTRLFGPDFVSPNAADFRPDPNVMVRKSVLSAVNDESKKLMRSLGGVDRARLDEYFTSIRQVENQLELQAQKPPPNEACIVPTPPDEQAIERRAYAVEVGTVMETHRMMTRILTMALACNQTKVFNMVYNDAFSRIRRPGETYTHHVLTHEEQADPKLGYQPQAFWFNCRSMEACADFIAAFKAIREGDGTLLDNTLVYAGSETSFARIHSVDNIPIMSFGKAGGRIKTGLHVVGNGDPSTRVAFTMMQVMGLGLEAWGTKSLRVTKPVSEILV
jgi:hypothetical protein